MSNDLIIQKMKNEGLSQEIIDEFLAKVEQVRNGYTGKVDWSTIGDLDPSQDEISLEEIQKNYSPNVKTLNKLVVIKLNGGLGTSMGLSKAKSLLSIKNGMSFLEIVTKQIVYYRNKFQIDIPLLLMDSYSTQEDCQNELKRIGFKQNFPVSFLQNKVPRLSAEDLTPVTLSDKKEEWCPPGHGDVYLAMKTSGILDKLLENGYEYAFLSNIDNLGATVEPHILQYFAEENLEFAMEMTPKTLADKKGGAIYRKVVEGQFYGLELLETAQVPEEYEHEFFGIGKFRTFSTNNLWINLKALKEKMKSSPLRLSLIVNPKIVEGVEVIQLETAMGSAIGNFQRTKCITIPRERFAPVKKTEDILIRMSDAYVLNEDYSLTMNPKRKEKGLGENVVSLEDKYYKKIDNFLKLFPVIPSLLYSQTFTVKGEVEFDTQIEIYGDVKIQNLSNTKRNISELQKVHLENEEVEFR